MASSDAPVVASGSNTPQVQDTQAAGERFDAALAECIEVHSRGEDLVFIEGSLPMLFGDLLVQHFQRTVVETLGTPVELTVMDGTDELYTLVKIFRTDTSAQTPAHEEATVDALAEEAGFKKAPRPMNCWIIFRDAKSKELKLRHPELSVQQISTRCSEIWHELTPEEKQPWQDAAQSAKEEHYRQHPDYKYSPRKPGQKKKRQSRKGKQAAAAAPTAQAAGKLQSTSNVAAASNVVGTLVLTGDEALGGFGIPPIGDWFDFFASEYVLEQATQELVTQHFRNAESMRQAQLEEEFGMFDFGEILAMWEEQQGVAFREGADNNATLPPYLEDTF